jgi:type IV pilus assembly protein PilB
MQYYVNKASILDKQITANVIAIIPAEIARRYKILPLEIIDGKLNVAMVDPFNVIALDDLYLTSGYEIVPFKVNANELEQAIDKYYGLTELDNLAFKEILQVKEMAAEYSQAEVNDAPVVRIVNCLIQQAIKKKASDIHIEPLQKTLQIRFRVDGILLEVNQLPMQAHGLIVSRFKILAALDIAEKRRPQDGRIDFNCDGKKIDLRVSVLPTVYGEKVVVRILDKTDMLISLDQLGMSQQVLLDYKSLIKNTHGMILFTGPAGSGKSTSLYATLNYLQNPMQNIVTIEDPVEYLLPGINQMNTNNKIGLTFSAGLRAILRQDPDIIMIGEIRDQETAGVAVQASNTGHLVFSTMHTNDAAGAITRLVDMGVDSYLVASAIRGVIAQRLVRKICNECKKEYLVPKESMARIILNIGPDQPLVLQQAPGCARCNGTGYKGRIALFEVLIVSENIQKLILQKASAIEISRQAINNGMLTYQQDGLSEVLCGLTTFDEVNRVAFDYSLNENRHASL